MDFLKSKAGRVLLCIALLGAGLRIYVYLASQWTILDGFIGYRFAEQFGNGNGLVFNAGERVSGNTSVLFTFLLGIAGALKLPIPETARTLGILADGGSLFLLWRMVSHHAQIKSLFLQIAIPTVIYLFPLTLIYAVSGMETTPYVFLVLLLFERTLSRTSWSWSGVAGLLMYCRPDSVVFIAMTLLFFLIERRRLPWMEGLTCLGFGLSYLAFNQLYYGTIIPNTVLTKSVAYHDSVAENFRFIGSRFFRSEILFAMFLILVAAAGIGWRKNRVVWLFLLAAAAYTTFLLKAPHLRTWYVVPFLYVALMVPAVAVAKFLDGKAWLQSQPILLLVAAGYCGFVLLGLRAALPPLREAKRYEIATRYEPGEWLRTNTLPGARVFVTALEVGYFSQRYTLDSPGLVTPRIWRTLKTNASLTLLEQAEIVDADYVVVPKGESRVASFEFVRDFACTPPSKFANMEYELFQRVRTNTPGQPAIIP